MRICLLHKVAVRFFFQSVSLKQEKFYLAQIVAFNFHSVDRYNKYPESEMPYKLVEGTSGVILGRESLAHLQTHTHVHTLPVQLGFNIPVLSFAFQQWNFVLNSLYR